MDEFYGDTTTIQRLIDEHEMKTNQTKERFATNSNLANSSVESAICLE